LVCQRRKRSRRKTPPRMGPWFIQHRQCHKSARRTWRKGSRNQRTGFFRRNEFLDQREIPHCHLEQNFFCRKQAFYRVARTRTSRPKVSKDR